MNATDGLAKVYIDRDMDVPEQMPVAGGRASVYSARCPDKETPNEDAAAVIAFSPETAVLVVADGMGGCPAGDQASRLAVESVCTAVEAMRGAEDVQIRTAILNGFENANRVVQDLGVGAGTTLAAVEITSDGKATVVRPYHVGDSEILVVGTKGKIKLQTVSHSPVGYGVQAGLIDEDEALVHADRHIVSNYIGSPEMHIAVGPLLRLARRDMVLLGSDGLFDNLASDEIISILRQGQLATKVSRLASESTLRMANRDETKPGKPDDLTMIVWYSSSPSKVAKPAAVSSA